MSYELDRWSHGTRLPAAVKRQMMRINNEVHLAAHRTTREAMLAAHQVDALVFVGNRTMAGAVNVGAVSAALQTAAPSQATAMSVADIADTVQAGLKAIVVDFAFSRR